MGKKRGANKKAPPQSLRQRAEEALRASRADITDMPAEEIKTLVQELQFHQLELEI